MRRIRCHVSDVQLWCDPSNIHQNLAAQKFTVKLTPGVSYDLFSGFQSHQGALMIWASPKSIMHRLTVKFVPCMTLPSEKLGACILLVKQPQVLSPLLCIHD
jgi:hypothetical protein